MDSVTGENNTNFLSKTWKRCRSFPRSRSSRRDVVSLAKSHSWNGEETQKNEKMTPEGYIPVCVGPEKQRFAVKTKYVNHPLFSTLLEDAETEYGYNCDGPIMLPCDVELFRRVLTEMEVQPDGRSFAYGSCSPFNPNRRLGTKGRNQMYKGYGSFEPLRLEDSLR